MIAFLIKNWKLVATAGVTMSVAFLLHTVSVSWIETSHIQALKDQKKALIAQCQKDQALTREVSDEYQSQIAALDRQLRELNSLPKHCVPISSSPGGRDGTPVQGEHGRPHGVTSYALFDFAGDAERYRLRLIACQSFIKKAYGQ